MTISPKDIEPKNQYGASLASPGVQIFQRFGTRPFLVISPELAEVRGCPSGQGTFQAANPVL
jgi:hypothetical protein